MSPAGSSLPAPTRELCECPARISTALQVDPTSPSAPMQPWGDKCLSGGHEQRLARALCSWLASTCSHQPPESQVSDWHTPVPVSRQLCQARSGKTQNGADHKPFKATEHAHSMAKRGINVFTYGKLNFKLERHRNIVPKVVSFKMGKMQAESQHNGRWNNPFLKLS